MTDPTIESRAELALDRWHEKLTAGTITRSQYCEKVRAVSEWKRKNICLRELGLMDWDAE